MNSQTTHGAPSWIEFNGESSADVRKFYENVLGWNVVDMPMQDGSSYPGIMVGEGPVGGFASKAADTNSWLIYITVDDVDKRFKAAIDGGAIPVSEPFSAPGVGRMATIKDPFGASIAFITYENKG